MKSQVWLDSQPYVVAYNPPSLLRNAPLSSYCSCVSYAKIALGFDGQSWGNAWEIEPDKEYPEIGDIFITSEGRGHIGIVVDIYQDRFKTSEANYKRCDKTSRWINMDYSKLKGFKSYKPITQLTIVKL